MCQRAPQTGTIITGTSHVSVLLLMDAALCRPAVTGMCHREPPTGTAVASTGVTDEALMIKPLRQQSCRLAEGKKGLALCVGC